MTKQEFRGASGILLPGAIAIPKGEEIAISQDWLIFPDAITGEGKVWTIDGLLEPCIKLDNEVWVDSNVENPFSEPIIYKGKNKYGWLVGEITEDVTNELDYINRKSVRNIILSNYVTEIPDQAFFDCYDLQNIIISNSVKRIGNIAFWNCGSIKNLTIPDTVVEMGGGVFSHCSALESIKLPNTLTQLYSYEYIYEDENHEIRGFFKHCNNLLTIVLPLTLQNIDNYAFYDCSSLTSITIPESVTSIGEYAFFNCYSMTSVTIGESVTSIADGTFLNCSGLTSIIFSEGLTSIGNWAFSHCPSLTSITIPNSVTLISGYAFYECYGINDLILGNSVNYIEHNAFSNCPLQRIVSYAETPPTIESNTFENVDRSIPLEVPNADLYREAPYWQEFYNIYNINPYQLNVSSNNEEWGTVRIREHNTNRSVIEAISKDGYAFKRWSDGDTSTRRELNITEDTTLVAEFGEPYQCEIVNLEVIDSTPTSVTVRFEVTCNEERDTLNSVMACINNGEFCGSVTNKPGILETTIEGLKPETMYQIRVSVRNDAWRWIDRYLEFTTPSLPYSYVDLGLPSGTLWANKNVGAKNPWDNGLYFDWGNVEGHAVDENGNITDGYSFNRGTYPTTLGGQYTGSTLDAEHDTATVNMGEGWRMPTNAEISELIQNTDHCYIGEDGNILEISELAGSKLRSICFIKKGETFDLNNRSNFIEIPFAGGCDDSLLGLEGLRGGVWSSSVYDDNAEYARYLYFYSDGSLRCNYSLRCFGNSVRGVKNN